MADLKSLAASAVGAWVAVGELPTLFHFLDFILGNVANPGDPANTERAGPLMAEVITNAIVPWWLEGLKFLAGTPLLAVAFIGFVKWSGTMDE